jgi:single-strand DNA-binding protein
MNSHITIAGNLTRDPEIRFTDSGMQVARFAVAVNHKDKSGEERTSFYDVVTFGGMAENVANTLTRGNRATVSGRLEVRSYEKKDGTPGTSVEVIADEVGVSLRFDRASVIKTERATAGAGARGGNSGGSSYEPF